MAGVPSGTIGIPEAELEGDVGTPDVDLMADIRDLFVDEGPLVADFAWNDPLSKRELHVRFSGGIGADWSWLDVTWYTSGAYKFHHVDDHGRNWRFDRHPNNHSPEKHFHEPPEADTRAAVGSCISVEGPGLVSRPVMKLWRRVVVIGTLELEWIAGGQMVGYRMALKPP